MEGLLRRSLRCLLTLLQWEVVIKEKQESIMHLTNDRDDMCVKLAAATTAASSLEKQLEALSARLIAAETSADEATEMARACEEELRRFKDMHADVDTVRAAAEDGKARVEAMALSLNDQHLHLQQVAERAAVLEQELLVRAAMCVCSCVHTWVFFPPYSMHCTVLLTVCDMVCL